MNIFKTCQPNNYSSDYTKVKKERAQKKDIKIISREKKTRRINNDLPFDINTNLKSNIDLTKGSIRPINTDITGIMYIDPNNKLFNTNCPYKYLDYTYKPRNCFFDISKVRITITAVGASNSVVNSGDSTNDANLKLTFTTSEATTDFILDDITITNPQNIANGIPAGLTKVSSTVYTATFIPDTNGICTINVAKNKFTDAAGNDNIAAPTFTWTKL